MASNRPGPGRGADVLRAERVRLHTGEGTGHGLRGVGASLARLIPRARLMLYPDAGHGFLFQDGTPFASLVDSFLTGHPSS